MTQEIIDMSGELRVLLWLLTIIVFFIFFLGRYMGTAKSYALLILYGLFLLYVVGLSFEHPIVMELSTFLREMLHAINGLFY
jgi:hypothetical protein